MIPNTGCLDTRSSITILGWVYPESPGPIFHFNPGGWGVHLWFTKVNEIFVRFMGRKRKNVPAISSRSVKARKWNYIAATYDHRTGIATLWNNARPIARKNIGRFNSGLATNHAVVVGAKPGDRRYFRGRIACLQVFSRALKAREIGMRKKSCFRPGKCSWFLVNSTFHQFSISYIAKRTLY